MPSLSPAVAARRTVAPTGTSSAIICTAPTVGAAFGRTVSTVEALAAFKPLLSVAIAIRLAAPSTLGVQS